MLSLNHLAVFDYHQGDDRKVKALLEEAGRMAEDAGLEEALVETSATSRRSWLFTRGLRALRPSRP